MTPRVKRAISLLLALSVTASLAGCSRRPEAPITESERTPLSVNIASEYAAASRDASSVIANFLYNLVYGNYSKALSYCYIEDGVLFDDAALQTCMLNSGIGRGDSITFYAIDSYGDTEYDVEYDLEYGGKAYTVSKTFKLAKVTEGYKIDLGAMGFVAKGNLEFVVPGKVDVYINDVYVDKKYLGNDNIYRIPNGVAITPVDEGETPSLTLRLETKFGISQEYPIVFMGSGLMTKSKRSINDDYYNGRYDRSYFKIEVPREMREETLLPYIKSVMPILFADIMTGTEWVDAKIRNKMNPYESQIDAMFPRYYKISNYFGDSVKLTEGRYSYRNPSVYNYDISDAVAEKLGVATTFVDYNIVCVSLACDYDFLYTRGSEDVERQAVGTLKGQIYLSVDDVGQLYIYDISETLFKVTRD